MAAGKEVFYARDITINRWVTASTYPLDSMAGRPYLIEFWAMWCRPCVDNLPHMNALYSKYSPKGLRIIGLSLDRDYNELIKFVKDKDIKYPIAMDNGTDARYGVYGIPAAILVDAAGIIVWGGHPGQEDLEEIIIETMKTAPQPVLEGIDISEFKEIKLPLTEGANFTDIIAKLNKYSASPNPLKNSADRIIKTINTRIAETITFADTLLKQEKTDAALNVYIAVVKNYGGSEGAKIAGEKIMLIKQNAQAKK